MGGKRITKSEVERWVEMYEKEGLPITKIAKKEGRPRETVGRKIKEHERNMEISKEKESEKRSVVSELFLLFDQGKDRRQAVMEGFDPDEVREGWEVWKEFGKDRELFTFSLFKRLRLDPKEAARFYLQVGEKLSCKGDELIERILCLMELKEILDREELDYKEASEILAFSKKIRDLGRRRFELEGKVEEMESRRAEVEEKIEQKEKAIAGLKTEMAEKLESISTDLENSIGGAISFIIADKEIRLR